MSTEFNEWAATVLVFFLMSSICSIVILSMLTRKSVKKEQHKMWEDARELIANAELKQREDLVDRKMVPRDGTQTVDPWGTWWGGKWYIAGTNPDDPSGDYEIDELKERLHRAELEERVHLAEVERTKKLIGPIEPDPPEWLELLTYFDVEFFRFWCPSLVVKWEKQLAAQKAATPRGFGSNEEVRR